MAEGPGFDASVPNWMGFEVQQKVKKDLFFVSANSRKRCLYIRKTNKSLQVETKIWKTISALREVCANISMQKEGQTHGIVSEELTNGLISEMEKEKTQLEAEFLQQCREEHQGRTKYAHIPGPCGELPVHTCLGMGLNVLARQLIDEFHSSSNSSGLKFDDVNAPYVSDFDAWRKYGYLAASHRYDDGGLFTGQTLLHLAVLRGDQDMVEWLIKKKGAWVNVRATGAFFKPKQMSINRKNKTSQHSSVVKQGKVPTFENADSVCVYGELPLSFAASTGHVEIMSVMKKCLEDLVTPTQALKFADADGDGFITRKEWGAGAMQDAQSYTNASRESDMALEAYHRILSQYPHSLRVVPARFSHAEHVAHLFLNMQDSDGNTALHMAVANNQLCAVDWLLNNGAHVSMHLMNSSGTTPLTLAAKCGLAHLFHHLKNSECFSKVQWRYGPVAYTTMNLEQIDTFPVKRQHNAGRGEALKARRNSFAHGDADVGGDELPLLQEAIESSYSEHPQWRCVLQIIAEDETAEFAQDAFFLELIHEKWDKFARTMLLTRKVVPHYMLTVAFIIVTLVRASEVRSRWEKAFAEGCNATRSSRLETRLGQPLACITQLYEPSKPIHFWGSGGDLAANFSERPREAYVMSVQLVLHIGMALFMLWTGSGWRQFSVGRENVEISEAVISSLKAVSTGHLRSVHKSLTALVFKNSVFLLDYLCSLFLILTIAYRCVGDEESELQMTANAAVVLLYQCVLMLIPWQTFGVFIITMYRMLTDELLRFFCIYLFVCVGFTFALTALTPYPASMDKDYGYWQLFWAQFSRLFFFAMTADGDQTWAQPAADTALVNVVQFVYAVLSCILLLNFLISIMSRNFQNSQLETYRMWLFPFAQMVLRYEAELPLSDRARPRYRIGEPKEVKVDAEDSSCLSQLPFYITKVHNLSEGKRVPLGPNEADASLSGGFIHASRHQALNASAARDKGGGAVDYVAPRQVVVDEAVGVDKDMQELLLRVEEHCKAVDDKLQAFIVAEEGSRRW